jgi:hypothetical protein
MLIIVKEKNDLSVFQLLTQFGFIIHNCEVRALTTYCIMIFDFELCSNYLNHFFENWVHYTIFLILFSILNCKALF